MIYLARIFVRFWDRRVLAIATCFVVVAATHRASAQGGPPMITDDTETVPKRHWEINSAFTIERGRDGEVLGIPLLDINYGTSSNTQLKVEIPWVLIHPTGGRAIGGVGNVNIGVRYRFRDETEHQRVALSIYPQVEFNTLQASVRRGIVDKGPEFLMPLQWQTQIGKYGVNGDFGYRFKRGPDEVIYGVVIGRSFKDERFELMGEVHGTTPRDSFSESEVDYNFGSRVRLTKHTTLLLSAGSSLRRKHDPLFIGYAGIQTTF